MNQLNTTYLLIVQENYKLGCALDQLKINYKITDFNVVAEYKQLGIIVNRFA